MDYLQISQLFIIHVDTEGKERHWTRRQERNLVLQKMQISESLASVLVVLSIAPAAYTKLWNPELAR